MTEPDGLAGAAGIVLPGVGAFGDAAANLRRRASRRRCATPSMPARRCWASASACSCSSTRARRWGVTPGWGSIPGRVRALRRAICTGRTAPPQGAADRLEPAQPRRDRPAAGRRAGWRLRLLRALVLLRAGRSRLHGGDDRFRRSVCLGRPARQRVGHPVPPGEEPGGGAAHSAEFRWRS